MNDIEKQWCKAKLEVRGDRFKELYCPDGYGCLLIEQKEGLLSSTFIAVKFGEHCTKVLLPIFVTLLGIVIEIKLLHW